MYYKNNKRERNKMYKNIDILYKKETFGRLSSLDRRNVEKEIRIADSVAREYEKQKMRIY